MASATHRTTRTWGRAPPGCCEGGSVISGKVRIFLLFSYTLPITSVPSLSGQVIIFGVELDSNARLQVVIASRASSHGRQSSDRSRGSRGTLSSQAISCPRLWRSCGWGGRSRRNTGEERSRLMRHFLMENDHLPRQARDKCKPKMFVENKLMFSFSQGAGRRLHPAYPARRAGVSSLHWPQFQHRRRDRQGATLREMEARAVHWLWGGRLPTRGDRVPRWR
jgi:hypothetical protein